MTNAIDNWPTRLRMKYGRVVHAAQPVEDELGLADQLYELRCLDGKPDRVLGEVPDGGDHVLDPATEVTCTACLRSSAP